MLRVGYTRGGSSGVRRMASASAIPLSLGSSANLIYDPQRSAISQSGGLISSITDLVGGTVQATASGAQRPTLAKSPIDGRNVIRFGGSMELNTPSTNVDPRNFTMVFVTDLSNFSGSSGNGQGVIAGFGGGSTRSIFYNNASVTAFDVSTLIGYGGTYNTGTFNIITIVGNSTNVIARCNGVELFNSPAFSATPNFTNIRLGRAENLVQSLIGCDIAYFEMYNSALDATARAANEDRLRAITAVKSLNTSINRYYFLGNSLTEGRGNTARDKRWAELSMYGSSLSTLDRENFLVRGYAGATTVQLTGAINTILTRYMGNGSNSYVFVWELSNDINISQNGTTAYDNLKTLCQNIKNDAPNTKIIAMTMLPRGAVAGVETARLVANGLVMGSTTAITGVSNFYAKGVDNIDYVFDVAGISTIGAPGSQSNTTYYQTDQVHLTDAGYALIGAGGKDIINFITQNIDYEAWNYIKAVEAADGQSLEQSVQIAINDFVVGCKADASPNVGVTNWQAIKAANFLAGARTLSGALVPLKGSAPTNYNFVSADYTRSTGLLGDGTTKFLDMNRNNNVDPQDNKHLTAWASGAVGSGTSRCAIGNGTTGAVSQVIFGSQGQLFPRINASTGILLGPIITSISGLTGLSRTNSSTVNSLLSGVTDTTSVTSSVPINNPTLVFCRGDLVTPREFFGGTIAFYSGGEAIDLVALSGRVSTYMTAIAGL